MEGGYFGLVEGKRLKDLDALDLLYTPAEARFDRITRLAARVLQCQIALVSFVTVDLQWVKSGFGLRLSEIQRDISFCGHTVMGHKALIIPDAAQDQRFSSNPLVTGPPSIRFYAGHPLHAGAGSAVGTLSVMDRLPRQFTVEEQETLQDLAAVIERELDHRRETSFQDQLILQQKAHARRGRVDELTRMWGRSTLMELAHLECAAASQGQLLSLMLIDIDGLNKINQNYGQEFGDTALSEIAGLIRYSMREGDVMGRYGAGTFMILLHAGIVDSNLAAERLCGVIARHGVPGIPVPVTASIGVACAKTQAPTPALLIAAADKAMRQAKESGRNQVEIVQI